MTAETKARPMPRWKISWFDLDHGRCSEPQRMPSTGTGRKAGAFDFQGAGVAANAIIGQRIKRGQPIMKVRQHWNERVQSSALWICDLDRTRRIRSRQRTRTTARRVSNHVTTGGPFRLYFAT